MLRILLPIMVLISCQGVQDETWYKVKYVIDGDTIIVEDGSDKGRKIRLIGINAPESRDYKHRKKEAFGKEARNHLIQLLGQDLVKLEYDVEKEDRYGRTLAYVHSKRGIFINAKMVEDGFAEIMTIAPNVKYVVQLADNQRDARKNKRGIWADI